MGNCLISPWYHRTDQDSTMAGPGQILSQTFLPFATAPLQILNQYQHPITSTTSDQLQQEVGSYCQQFCFFLNIMRTHVNMFRSWLHFNDVSTACTIIVLFPVWLYFKSSKPDFSFSKWCQWIELCMKEKKKHGKYIFKKQEIVVCRFSHVLSTQL